MKTLKGNLWTAAAGAVLFSSTLFAQAPAASTTTAHGHVQNAAGQPIPGVTVEFTKDKSVAYKDAKMAAKVTGDANGNYTAPGLTPGDYFMYVSQGDKHIDQIEVTIKPNTPDMVVDDDMTRADYIAKMTPEEKKQIEEFKKKNAEIMKSNSVIANLNNTLKQVRADLAAAAPTKGDVSKDVADMKQATDQKPDEPLLWLNYGDAAAAQGDHLAAADKAAGKVASSDPDTMAMYDTAVTAYKTGIDKDAASKKPLPVQEAVGYGQMGNVLAKENKIPEATAAYESAAKADPTKAGLYYNNEAAVMLNASQSEAALAAAEKAIAADPNRADPYYIKGQVLVQKATLDPKSQKLVAPPGCIEAYSKYLELEPNGKFAPSIKEVLAAFDQTQVTKFGGKKR
ncbi:Tetratricopeptide repeat-containing protein [Bryocella elongata]|uniref:Tetratricopeptide repeat-containing protein n=1 Tax=Bryocella elongata TaxID=863522 RepID=A0A1H6AKU0_9BACT|nr:carboxypeptidase-like regulatory domain-containing protein [Bryocella elongata]SEG48784.1 Tetratricopeptide repeat-containing protein [Bryocella elongata]